LTKGDDNPTNKVANKQAFVSFLQMSKEGGDSTNQVAGEPAPPTPTPLSSKDKEYLRDHAGVVAELRGFQLRPAQQDHGDARWQLLCDAAPRGLLPRAHEPWSHTGSVTFATWWEVANYDGLVYLLRGLRSLRELTILRNVMSVLRISCRGMSSLGRPAYVPSNLRDRAVRACVAYEDATPVVAHRHSAHVPIHLVTFCWVE
jgi:hypothetical protein